MASILSSIINVRSVLLQILLVGVCVLGDFMIKTDVRWRRALYDTITHGCIAFLSWAVVSNALHESPAFVSALLCGILAMVLDGDHFYEARSFQLEVGFSLNLKPITKRNILHININDVIFYLRNMNY